jgi:hypothetical protein
MSEKEEEEMGKKLAKQILELLESYGRKIDTVQGERTKKLNEIVKKGKENIKEHDTAFKLFRVQGEAKAKELDLEGKDFYGKEAEEFKKEVVKKREELNKKYEDQDKFIVVEYMETITKYNREIEKLDKELKEKTGKVLEKINRITGGNLQMVFNPPSLKKENWRELMGQKGGGEK